MPRKKSKAAAGTEEKQAGGDGRGQSAGQGRGGGAAGPAGTGGMPAMPVARGGGGRGIFAEEGQPGGGRGRAYAPVGAPMLAHGGAADPGFVPGPESFPGPPQAAGGRGAPAAAPPGRGRYMPVVGEFPPPAQAAAAPGGGAARGIGVPAAPPVAAPTPVRATPVEVLAEEVAKLQVQPAAPASSKAVRFPDRPSLGTLGSKFPLKVNHFQMQVASKDTNLYRVEITPTVLSRGLNRAVIRELVEQFAQDLGNRLPVFDGRNSLYVAGLLPFEHKDFRLVLPDERPASGKQPARERIFKVSIKHAAKVDLDHLMQFMKQRQADLPQETLQALDIVLREMPSRHYTPIGRSFYSPDLGQKRLGEGLVGWRGFYQSVRPTQMGLSLNVNISATAVLEPIDVLDFVREHLTARRMGNFARGFSPEQRREVLKALRGVKVEVTHRGDQRRKYRVSKLTDLPTRDLNFSLSDGTQTNVQAYFRKTYNYNIQHVELPCLNVGSTPQKPSYLPMEVCRILPGQRYPARQLVDQTRTSLLGMTSQRPADRENEILRVVQRNRYGEDAYVKEFGIKIAEKFTSVTARLLDPPSLMYKAPKGEGIAPMQVSRGAWNMFSKRFVTGGSVKSWACVSFNSRLAPAAAERFCQALAQKCSSLGMAFNPQPVLGIQNLNTEPGDLKNFLARCPGGAQGLGLLIAIFPDFKTDWYGELKRICETEVGVISQVCWSKHVQRCDDQYLANVALKINVKAGGRNTVLKEAMQRTLPTLGKTTTIIFGADVTHPSPGEDEVPSIAAVVASQDWPEVTTYAGQVSAQAGRVEIIVNLQDMVKNLLRSFYERTRQKPERLLFYRDGVSEGQFNEVLGSELTSIQKACQSIEAQYKPLITFVVVQKRHHTRFFPADQKFGDRNGNVLAGTVVDTQICHPREFDFYLCSHAGLLGTSRPAHYHVLWDDNKFTADSLQTLTNSLCSTYQRCTRSVSIVPPAYYAHHLAARARIYMGQGNAPPAQVHQRLRSIMYYC